MGYLRLYDYTSNIQTPALNQLLQGIDAKRILKEAASQAQITSYLIQKYDTAAEFQNTVIFNSATTYQANTLIELNFNDWTNIGNYTAGNTVNYTDGNCYICILATTGAHEVPTNITYWAKLGAKYDLYYIAYPYPLFNLKTQYFEGDRVFWKGKIYKNLIPTIIPDHIAELQSYTYANIPQQNIFPDDPINGVLNWGVGVLYSVTNFYPNSVLPTAWNSSTTYISGVTVAYNGVVWKSLKENTNVIPGSDIETWQSQTWTYGDNRNAQIVECMVWITLTKLSPLISPRNIPELWQKKYDECLVWLQMCAQGDVTLSAPELQPSQGARIRFGGQIRKINGY